MHRILALSFAVSCAAAILGPVAPVLADACCFPNGACLDDCGFACPVDALCIEGVDCSDEPCSVQACCTSTGCQVLDIFECFAIGGKPQGPTSSCPDACISIEACCLPDDQCIEVAASECFSQGGETQGAFSTCASNPCKALEACCIEGGDCLELFIASCTDLGGLPQGPGSVCDAEACGPVTACCLAGHECIVESEVLCLAQGGEPQASEECAPELCMLPEACCRDRQCFEMTPASCVARGGQPQGHGTICLGDLCESTQACCLKRGGCLDDFDGACLAGGGEPQGPGTTCLEVICDPCPAGAASMIAPADGVVDARQPHPVNDATTMQGIQTLEVQAPSGAGYGCWSLCQTADGGMGVNAIVAVEDHGDDTYSITLLRPITPGAVTTISYDGVVAGRVVAHPANVNGDSVSGPLDILAIIDCLNDVKPAANCPWVGYSVDVDHSGHPGPADILTVIDLLNGAGEFDPWSGTQLPSNDGCP
jgi:hypothetical protein